jgi:hypothetical protein
MQIRNVKVGRAKSVIEFISPFSLSSTGLSQPQKKLNPL